MLKRMIRMACDAVLTMDKLAGYNEPGIQSSLIKKYKVYFDFAMTQEEVRIAQETMESRIKEEVKRSHQFFLTRCKNEWFK